MEIAEDGGQASQDRRHILIAVDNSDVSQEACDYAIANFYKPGDTFTFIHIVPTTRYDDTIDTAAGVLSESVIVLEASPAVETKAVKDASDFILERFLGRTAAAGIPSRVEIVPYLTDTTAIGDIICRRARELSAKAVVIASHEKGAIQEWFMGSVCRFCTQNCSRPLLIYHARRPKA